MAGTCFMCRGSGVIHTTREGAIPCTGCADDGAIVVTLDQVIGDDADAVRDHERAVARGWGPEFLPRGGVVELVAKRVASYRAERAASFYLGVSFVRDPNGFKKPDVGGYEVRFTEEVGGDLRTKESDGPSPYLLVYGTTHPFLFHVRGTITRDAAKALKARGIGRRRWGAQDDRTWYIPARYLTRVARGSGAWRG